MTQEELQKQTQEIYEQVSERFKTEKGVECLIVLKSANDTSKM